MICIHWRLLLLTAVLVLIGLSIYHADRIADWTDRHMPRGRRSTRTSERDSNLTGDDQP